jgi:ubiquinone/menaquinone biosynthesis C-methylase UbiE
LLPENDILSFYGKINSPFLHAKGEEATEIILDLLKPRTGEKILEIGFGTGATLVKIAARSKGSFLYGVEGSEIMVRKASARMRLCQLNKIQLGLYSGLFLPFADSSMDKLLVESVFAFQEIDQLKSMLAECFRVLKPGGKFFLNETIWLSSTTPEMMRNINQLCQERFGIIQSVTEFPTIEAWEELMRNIGFEIDFSMPVDQFKNKMARRKTFREKLSDLYSGLGRLKKIFTPDLRKKEMEFNKLMSKMSGDQQLMQGYFLVLRKPKN